MCREDYAPGVNDSFCIQSCSGGRCEKAYDEIRAAQNAANGCAYLVSDDPNKIEDGNFMLLRGDRGYKESSDNSYDVNRNYYDDTYWRTQQREGKIFSANRRNPMKTKRYEKVMVGKNINHGRVVSVTLPHFWKRKSYYTVKNRYGTRGRYKHRNLRVGGGISVFGGSPFSRGVGRGRCTHVWCLQQDYIPQTQLEEIKFVKNIQKEE